MVRILYTKEVLLALGKVPKPQAKAAIQGKESDADSTKGDSSRTSEPGDAQETGSRLTGGLVRDESKNRPRATLYTNDRPEIETPEKKAEVELHNKEFEKGHDRAPKAPEHLVDEKFWNGKFFSLVDSQALVYLRMLTTDEVAQGEINPHNVKNGYSLCIDGDFL